MSSLIGKTIGQYKIVEQIGAGGMATVFKAYQATLNRHVALKILPTQFAHDPSFVKRFTQEAQAIAALEHPNILPMFDFGTQEGLTYMVMRYVEGGTLAKIMGQPMSNERIVEIVGGVARALDYAHSEGVVHRDIKPSNILIGNHGEPLLTDFGIAKIMAGSGGTQLTGTGSILGTPEYMAPEQAGGTAVDGRTDIYSLGVVLYELLTGRPPYQAKTPLAVVLMHVNEPLPPPRSINPAIPEPLERVVLKAMAKDRNQRYQTAGQMEQALKEALKEIESTAPTADVPAFATQSEGIPQAIPQPSAKSGRSIFTNPLLIGGGLVAIFLCLVGGAIATWAIARSMNNEGITKATPTGSSLVQATIAATTETIPAPTSDQAAPTSTATALPTPETGTGSGDTVISDMDLDGEILFEDRFDSDRNGWSIGQEEDEYGTFTGEIADGHYRLSGQAKQGVFRWEQPVKVDFDNFVLSVDATPVEQNAPFGYGVIFRVNSEEDYYTFTIDEGNAFSVFTSIGGDWQALVASRRMAAINSNGLNQLTVKAVDHTLSFFINGKEAITIEDDTFESGSIGLSLELYNEGDSATVDFDNFIVRAISDEESAQNSNDILFADNFDSDVNGWATGDFEDDYSQNEFNIEGGKYTFNVTSKKNAYVEKALPNRQFSDFILTVEATPRDAEEHYSYGVAFREDTFSEYTYTFELGNDGLYAIFLYDGEWKKLKDWSSAKAIRAGQTNEVTVKAEGSTFTFFINGEQLTTLEDDTLAEGAIGLLVDMFEEGKSATVDFDNLIIRPTGSGNQQ